MEIPPITFTRTDGSQFTLQPRPPRSFAARYDLAAALSNTSDPSKAFRITLAGLGMGLTGQHPPGEPHSLIPAYRNDGEMLAYGGSIAELIGGKWGIAMTEHLTMSAVVLCRLLVASLPTVEGIKAKEDFTSPPEGAST